MTDHATNSAEQNTDWARERTRLAMDRTLAAFVRTALSFMGFGVAVAKLLPDLNPPWIPETIGILLIAGGLAAALQGILATHPMIAKFHQEGVKVPRWFVTINVLLVLVVAVAALLVVGLA